MSNFCSDQGRTRVFSEAYFLYAAAGNPRRTQIRAKRAIYGWKLNSWRYNGYECRKANWKSIYGPYIYHKNDTGKLLKKDLPVLKKISHLLTVINFSKYDRRYTHLSIVEIETCRYKKYNGRAIMTLPLVSESFRRLNFDFLSLDVCEPDQAKKKK